MLYRAYYRQLLTPRGPGCSTSTTSCTACSTDLLVVVVPVAVVA